jgi:hypothetical protein
MSCHYLAITKKYYIFLKDKIYIIMFWIEMDRIEAEKMNKSVSPVN